MSSKGAPPTCAECETVAGTGIILYHDGGLWFCEAHYSPDWDDLGDASRLLEAGRDEHE